MIRFNPYEIATRTTGIIAITFALSFHIIPTQKVVATKINNCQAALLNARQRIRVKKYHVVDIKREKHGYKTHPANRDFAYLITFTGNGDLLRSEMLLNSISTNIISNCPSIGLVRFGYPQSDGLAVYGLMKNGNIKPFQCSKRMSFPEWGYEPCTGVSN